MPEMNTLDTDVRIIRRKLDKGFVSQASVDEMLADLPDVEEGGHWFDPLELEVPEDEPTDEPDADAEPAEATDAT